jgi:RecG-like helicase
MQNNQIQKFQAALLDYENKTPFDQSLHITESGDVDIYFSPFEYVNRDAKVVLVGMSPGGTQAQNANVAAQKALKEGKSVDMAGKIAKETGSFSGALRNNLVAMLDDIGVSKKIGIESAISLSHENASLLHSTSVFRYPTLLKGKPISSAKSGLKKIALKDMIDSCLAKECELLGKDTLYVPLGQGVGEILLYLAEQRIISSSQILIGLPHPSGANAERISYFLGRKERSKLSAKTNPDKLDEARRKLLSQVASS